MKTAAAPSSPPSSDDSDSDWEPTAKPAKKRLAAVRAVKGRVAGEMVELIVKHFVSIAFNFHYNSQHLITAIISKHKDAMKRLKYNFIKSV